jgi:putative GTP pyrophosphokinase
LRSGQRMRISRSQLDRLGERLRKGSTDDTDLRLLEEFRGSFREPYEVTIREVRERLGLEPSGRPGKSNLSLIEKLRRESIRLTQVRDIAGCRVIVDNIGEQDGAVSSLVSLFTRTTVVDRRKFPSHGYRAVHVIAEVSGMQIEIQVRTELQHMWAELSEKLSDVLDPTIKYGGGDERLQQVLTALSEGIAKGESVEGDIASLELRLAELRKRIMDGKRSAELPADKLERLEELRTTLEDRERRLVEVQEKMRIVKDELIGSVREAVLELQARLNEDQQ